MKFFKIKNLFSVPSLLNIIGIAIAIAAFYVLVSLADHEFSFNHSIDRHEDTYMINYSINGAQSTYLMRPLPEKMCQGLASVESYGCFQSWCTNMVFAKRNGVYNNFDLPCARCSKGLLDVFGFRIVEGDTAHFNSREQMIISQSVAKKYDLKVGEMVKTDLQSKGEVEIVAIYEDFAHNTEFAQYKGFVCIGDECIDTPVEWSYVYYAKLFPGSGNPSVDMDGTIRDMIKDFYKDEPDVTEEQLETGLDKFKIVFVPLDELHLHEEIKGYHQRFDKRLAYTIVILAIFVILIAFINYFNFFIARVPQRLKSINTRKVLGSSRSSLIASVIGESVIFTVVSMAIAAVIVYTVISMLVSGVVDMDSLVYSNYKALIITIFTALAASVLTSLYPAFYITSIPPAMALKGQLTQGHDSKLRYILIGFQVAASVFLIICALFVHRNNDYIKNRDIGFNHDNVLCTYTTPKISFSRETVRDKLLQNTDITDVTWAANNLVATMRMTWGRTSPSNQEETIYFEVYPVAYNFLDFMGIDITEGRNFTESDERCKHGTIIYNETARRELGLTTESGIHGHHDESCELAGFCKDFNYKPLQYGISPFAFYVFGEDMWGWTLQHLYIRTTKDADDKKTAEFIRATLSEIDPDFEILNSEIISFDTELEANYKNEQRVLAMVTIFTTIAIIISVMGIFGIVLFDTERRRKEIGIRKVNGATVMEILTMFNRKFLILTAICSVIAIPLAFVVISAYFSGFSYHYDINIWPFVIGVLVTLIVTMLVVTCASYRAANENPMETLKME